MRLLDNSTYETNASSSSPVGGNDTLLFWFISVFYCCVELIGVFGNLLVILAILCNRKMRACCTNILILNIAVADLIIMLIGIAEITREFIGQGWIFGLALCKLQRHLLTSSLYASVLTMAVLSFERFFVIVHAVRSRTRLMCTAQVASMAVCAIWPVSFLCASPTLIWNTIVRDPFSGMLFCRQLAPMLTYYRIAECVFFYVVPLTVQAVLYSFVSKHLFRSIKGLRENSLAQFPSVQDQHKVVSSVPILGRRVTLQCPSAENRNDSSQMAPVDSVAEVQFNNGVGRQMNFPDGDTERLRTCRQDSFCVQPAQRDGDYAKRHAIEARKQVVRMLIVCVALYAIAYSPTVFNACFGTLVPVKVQQVVQIFSMCLMYLNHAGNPIIYAIFSTKFRQAFRVTCVSLCTRPIKFLLHQPEERPTTCTSNV